MHKLVWLHPDVPALSDFPSAVQDWEVFWQLSKLFEHVLPASSPSRCMIKSGELVRICSRVAFFGLLYLAESEYKSEMFLVTFYFAFQ